MKPFCSFDLFLPFLSPPGPVEKAASHSSYSRLFMFLCRRKDHISQAGQKVTQAPSSCHLPAFHVRLYNANGQAYHNLSELAEPLGLSIITFALENSLF